jgi:hypothetical protein
MYQEWKNINEIKIGDTIVIGTNYINDSTSIATRKVKNIHKTINAVSYDNTGLVYFPKGKDDTFLVIV